jgi:hypothetical protein
MKYEGTDLQQTIAAVLAEADASTAPSLGEEPNEIDAAKVTPKLVSGLQMLQGTDRHLILVLVVLICVLFLTGLGLVIYYRDNPTRVSLVLGGNYLSLLVIVGFLRRIWLEKRTIDALLVIAESLKPAEAAKTLVAFHFRCMQAKGRFV